MAMARRDNFPIYFEQWKMNMNTDQGKQEKKKINCQTNKKKRTSQWMHVSFAPSIQTNLHRLNP